MWLVQSSDRSWTVAASRPLAAGVQIDKRPDIECLAGRRRQRKPLSARFVSYQGIGFSFKFNYPFRSLRLASLSRAAG